MKHDAGIMDEGLKIEKVDEIKPEKPTEEPIDKQYDSRLTLAEQPRRVVTSAPTDKPQNSKEQIKIAKISGTYYIYIYFPEEGVYKRVAVT